MASLDAFKKTPVAMLPALGDSSYMYMVQPQSAIPAPASSSSFSTINYFYTCKRAISFDNKEVYDAAVRKFQSETPFANSDPPAASTTEEYNLTLAAHNNAKFWCTDRTRLAISLKLYPEKQTGVTAKYQKTKAKAQANPARSSNGRGLSLFEKWRKITVTDTNMGVTSKNRTMGTAATKKIDAVLVSAANWLKLVYQRHIDEVVGTNHIHALLSLCQYGYPEAIAGLINSAYYRTYLWPPSVSATRLNDTDLNLTTVILEKLDADIERNLDTLDEIVTYTEKAIEAYNTSVKNFAKLVGVSTLETVVAPLPLLIKGAPITAETKTALERMCGILFVLGSEKNALADYGMGRETYKEDITGKFFGQVNLTPRMIKVMLTNIGNGATRLRDLIRPFHRQLALLLKTPPVPMLGPAHAGLPFLRTHLPVGSRSPGGAEHARRLSFVAYYYSLAQTPHY